MTRQNLPLSRNLRALSSLLGAVGLFLGCSVINSFEDVAPEIAGDGDGDTRNGDGDRGDGDGDTNGDGDGDMGGAGTGGRGMGGGDGDGDTSGDGDVGDGDGDTSTGGVDGTGGDGTGGDGTGGMPIDVEPGLVVAIESGNMLDNDVLYALSPQDGSELQTDIADYKTAAYEPERDFWFFVRDNQIVAARFDRATNEWNFESETGPEVLAVTDFTEQFFALNDFVALKVGTKLQVYNTSDPADITFQGEVDYPVGTLWGAAAYRRTPGGRVVILTKNCPTASATTCPVELVSVTINKEVVSASAPEIVVPDFENALAPSATGNIRFDIGLDLMVALVPNPDTTAPGAVGKLATAYLYTPDTLNPGPTAYRFQQPGNQLGAMDLDPCHSVAYTMSPQSENVSGFPLTDDVANIPLFEPVGLNGRRVVYEPFTRSLILIEDESGDFGLDAYRLDGTATEPSIRKRIPDWSPPAVRPKFVAVATTENPVCN